MTHTADSLAAEFLSRAGKGGTRKLSAKQGQWLYDLATREAGTLAKPRGILNRRWLTKTWMLVEQPDGGWVIGEVHTNS